jgi:hypothetical protein
MTRFYAVIAEPSHGYLDCHVAIFLNSCLAPAGL